MKKQLVYDLPTRLFHWVFAGLFVAAFLIAKNIDDESVVFSYHMMLGLTLALVVVWRLVWAVIGSRYARFSSFDLKPGNLFAYFKGLLTGGAPRQMGHNPASSWAAIVMMALALGLALTGYQMANGGNKELFEDAHEIMANAFLVVVLGHILGVIFHTVRHRDALALSMVHGKKDPVTGGVAIQQDHRFVGLGFVLMVGLFGFYLVKGFDPNTRSLNVFGTTLQLGEAEGGEAGSENEGSAQENEASENENEDDD